MIGFIVIMPTLPRNFFFSSSATKVDSVPRLLASALVPSSRIRLRLSSLKQTLQSHHAVHQSKSKAFRSVSVFRSDFAYVVAMESHSRHGLVHILVLILAFAKESGQRLISCSPLLLRNGTGHPWLQTWHEGQDSHLHLWIVGAKQNLSVFRSAKRFAYLDELGHIQNISSQE